MTRPVELVASSGVCCFQWRRRFQLDGCTIKEHVCFLMNKHLLKVRNEALQISLAHSRVRCKDHQGWWYEVGPDSGVGRPMPLVHRPHRVTDNIQECGLLGWGKDTQAGKRFCGAQSQRSSREPGPQVLRTLKKQAQCCCPCLGHTVNPETFQKASE